MQYRKIPKVQKIITACEFENRDCAYKWTTLWFSVCYSQESIVHRGQIFIPQKVIAQQGWYYCFAIVSHRPENSLLQLYILAIHFIFQLNPLVTNQCKLHKSHLLIASCISWLQRNAKTVMKGKKKAYTHTIKWIIEEMKKGGGIQSISVSFCINNWYYAIDSLSTFLGINLDHFSLIQPYNLTHIFVYIYIYKYI